MILGGENFSGAELNICMEAVGNDSVVSPKIIFLVVNHVRSCASTTPKRTNVDLASLATTELAGALSSASPNAWRMWDQGERQCFYAFRFTKRWQNLYKRPLNFVKLRWLKRLTVYRIHIRHTTHKTIYRYQLGCWSWSCHGSQCGGPASRRRWLPWSPSYACRRRHTSPAAGQVICIDGGRTISAWSMLAAGRPTADQLLCFIAPAAVYFGLGWKYDSVRFANCFIAPAAVCIALGWKYDRVRLHCTIIQRITPLMIFWEKFT